jgi:ankyrin repeat protein
MYAAGNNHFPMVEYLLKNGANAGLKNKSGYSAYNLTTRDDIKKILQEAL